MWNVSDASASIVSEATPVALETTVTAAAPLPALSTVLPSLPSSVSATETPGATVNGESPAWFPAKTSRFVNVTAQSACATTATFEVKFSPPVERTNGPAFVSETVAPSNVQPSPLSKAMSLPFTMRPNQCLAVAFASSTETW